MDTSKRPIPQLTASSARQLPTAAPPLASAAIRATCTCLSTLMLDGRGGVACAACRAPVVAAVEGTPRPHSQRDGERPAGCDRVRYLRAWRLLARSGDPEAWAEGRARLMTPSAWSRAMAKHRPMPAAPASAVRAVDPEEAILSDLGLTRRSAS